MSQSEEMATDQLWNEMMEFACKQQQYLYETLSECTIYKSDEHEYLKNNIGYAIYGPPDLSKPLNSANLESTNENSIILHLKQMFGYGKHESPNNNTTENTTKSNNNSSKPEHFDNTDENKSDTVDTTNMEDHTIDYNENQKHLINKIYNIICECAIEKNKKKDSQLIYFGIIYNVICSKESMKQETENVQEEHKKDLLITPIPIFTIRKNIQKQEAMADETSYETWYIDTSARVYKNWSAYKENNNLPECTMVLPKDGCYQADNNFPVTENCSTVWLEIMDCPASMLQAKLCKGLDIASLVFGVGGMGICVASIFTPLGPIALTTGAFANGASGVWGIGRSIQHLIDRNKHEEPIFDKETIPHWISLAGSVTGLGVIGGSAALSRAAANGRTVNVIAKTAFNTVQGGSVFFNGVGIIYQGYSMVDNYTKGEPINYIDAISFMAHTMFFTHSVVNIQFANDIIKTTQGTIIDDYKKNLRNKNLRRKFNRIKHRANAKNTNVISENADVIRYINNRQDLVSLNAQNVVQKSEKRSFNFSWSFNQGKLKIDDILLIAPCDFVLQLIHSTRFAEIVLSDQSNSENSASDSTVMTREFHELLRNLVTTFYGPNSNCTNLPNFEPLLRDISSMNLDENSVKILFHICKKLLRHSKNSEEFLLNFMTFVWQYCKANLIQYNIKIKKILQSYIGSRILKIIIQVLYEAIEHIINNLSDAVLIYMKDYLHHNSFNA